ncbi:RNA polymerase sigma factor [Rugosimonospora africana]|nr:RNA polymerase sigma factor [Rugosimonospora africana]
MTMTAQSARSPSDADILRESRDRPGRFADLFDAYHGQIHRYIASRLSAGHADDLAAETFLVAFRGRKRFGGQGGHVRAWLYGIATNLIRRHRRDEERKYRALGRIAASDGTDVHDNDEDQIAARLDALGVRRDLGAALRSLKPADRDVLLLIALAELSYAEVAVALGIAEGTVASRLNRARRTVRAALADADPARTRQEHENG